MAHSDEETLKDFIGRVREVFTSLTNPHRGAYVDTYAASGSDMDRLEREGYIKTSIHFSSGYELTDLGVDLAELGVDLVSR